MSSTSSWNYYSHLLSVRNVSKINYLGGHDRFLMLIEARREANNKNDPFGTCVKGADENGNITVAVNPWIVYGTPGENPCEEQQLPTIYGDTIPPGVEIQGDMTAEDGTTQHIVNMPPQPTYDNIIGNPVVLNKAMSEEEIRETEERLRALMTRPIPMFGQLSNLTKRVADEANKPCAEIKEIDKDGDKIQYIPPPADYAAKYYAKYLNNTTALNVNLPDEEILDEWDDEDHDEEKY